MTADPPRRIAIIGAGSIGIAWSIVFARAGLTTVLHDADARRLPAARADIENRLTALREARLLDQSEAAVRKRIRTTADLADAVRGATHVQECAPEDLELKRAIFRELDSLAPPPTTLASSSSALVCSVFAGELPGRGRCLIVHPANPPYLLPIAEVVPAPFTDPATIASAEDLLRTVGIAPVRVHHEVQGFVFNRLQGALLREAYCLVRDGVVSVADVDALVRDGLGLRWAVIGPFATAELNTRGGIEAHAARLGPAYARMGADRGQHDPWTPELVRRVAEELHRSLPPADWETNVERRDQAIMRILVGRGDSPLPS